VGTGDRIRGLGQKLFPPFRLGNLFEGLWGRLLRCNYLRRRFSFQIKGPIYWEATTNILGETLRPLEILRGNSPQNYFKGGRGHKKGCGRQQWVSNNRGGESPQLGAFNLEGANIERFWGKNYPPMFFY